jgi:hypothetical protein
VVQDIITTHTVGLKPTRTTFDMSFYLIFYAVVFCIVILIGKITNKDLSSLKISLLSLSIAAVFLLAWNFMLGPIFMGEFQVGGVSAALSSMLSIIILILCSVSLGTLHYCFKRATN